MNMSFPYRVKAENLMVLSLVNIYRSFLGVCNVVLFASMIGLAIRFWSNTDLLIRSLIILGILVTPLIQPLMIYLKSRTIVNAMPGNMELAFSDVGFTISTDGQSSFVKYNDLKSVIPIAGMLILYTRDKRGFILNNQSLGERKESLNYYLKKQLK